MTFVVDAHPETSQRRFRHPLAALDQLGREPGAVDVGRQPADRVERGR